MGREVLRRGGGGVGGGNNPAIKEKISEDEEWYVSK